MATGRNELCPCGSGQKYKSCCINKDRGTSRGLIYLMIAIACIAAVGVAASFVGRDDDRPAPAQTAASGPSTPQPQPPGPAPAGKVWSAEHGHWHDANPAAATGAQPTKDNPITMTPRPRRNVPQPPGPVPAGKVWSPEHGHWHTKKK